MDQGRLIERLQKREASALQDLYDHYSGSLMGVIFRITQNREMAEDLLQDTFIKIWKNIDQYDPDKGRLYTWMHRIARNTTLNHLKLKSEKIKPADLVEDDYSGRYGIQNTNIEVLDLKGKVNTLEPTYIEVIQLVYFQGYTQSEAAKHLEIPLGTVKTRCRIALRELKKIYSVIPDMKKGIGKALLTIFLALWTM